MESQAPAILFFPACDIAHIAGGLDPVAPPAETLEIFPGPRAPPHCDRPDVVHDAGWYEEGFFMALRSGIASPE